MSRVCTICSHPEREAIDAAVVAGEPERAIAGRFSLARTSLQRHRPHTAARLALAEKAQARTLATLLDSSHEEVDGVIERAREAEEDDLLLKALDRRHKFAELEFGTKAAVTATVRDLRHELTELPPAQRRERLAEIRHRLLELEEEFAANGGNTEAN